MPHPTLATRLLLLSALLLGACNSDSSGDDVEEPIDAAVDAPTDAPDDGISGSDCRPFADAPAVGPGGPLPC